MSTDTARTIKRIAISAAPTVLGVAALGGVLFLLGKRLGPYLQQNFGSWLMLNDNWQDNISKQLGGELKAAVENEPLLARSFVFQTFDVKNRVYGQLPDGVIIIDSFLTWANKRSKVAFIGKDREEVVTKWIKLKVLDIQALPAVNTRFLVTQGIIDDMNKIFDMSSIPRSSNPLQVSQGFNIPTTGGKTTIDLILAGKDLITAPPEGSNLT